MSEPKVTECWAKELWQKDHGFYGRPTTFNVSAVPFNPNYRPAILMWREDYDAMQKELEELREKVSELCTNRGWKK